MSDPKDREGPLNALHARIEAAKERQAPAPPADEHYSQAQQGWRMVTELVAGLLIGTMPLFLILFTLLGFIAGVRTMLRTAEEIQRKREADEALKRGNETRGGRG